MKFFAIFALFLSISFTTVSAGEINKSFFGGIAIGGYDPVAYFLVKKPSKGKSEYSYKWKKATWHFSSSSNRDLFASDPEKYAPQFGGHCANGLSEGHKVNGNPKIWRMIDGKLYFFYAESGRKRWATNTKQWIKDAWKNWETKRFD